MTSADTTRPARAVPAVYPPAHGPGRTSPAGQA
jgi:hypothetical protein